MTAPAPSHGTPAPADIPTQDERYRTALLAALRIVHVKLRIALHDLEDIGTELKEERLTPLEAMRLVTETGLDMFFPRGGDDG